MAAGNESFEIITCFSGSDLERCRRLCDSVDRFVSGDIHHTVIVPPQDYAALEFLQSGRRTLMTSRDVLPASFEQLRGGIKDWLDRHNWAMEQLVRLSVTRATDAELLLFADSELQFVRSFETQALYRDGKLRLHRVPTATQDGRQRRWHTRAGALLGDNRDYSGSDYGGQLISWRRSNLVALQQHIEKTHDRPWYASVSRGLDIPGYALYGSFVEHVLGEQGGGHFYESSDLCRCCWFDFQARDLLEGKSSFRPHEVALLLQSKLGLGLLQERAVLDAALGGPALA